MRPASSDSVRGDSRRRDERLSLGFFATERVSWEQGAVASREFDLYVHAVRRSPLYERGPQPIVHVVVRDVADNVTPPIDALVEVGERLFHPLQSNGDYLIFPPFVD